jgi:hypothetical protein
MRLADAHLHCGEPDFGLALSVSTAERGTEMKDDITKAIISGNYLDAYWALKRQPPDQVREALDTLDPATLAAFVAGLINEWYRLRAALDAANEALDIDSDF